MSAQEYGKSVDERESGSLAETIARSTSVVCLAIEVQRFLAGVLSARQATYQLMFDGGAQPQAIGIRVALPDGAEKTLRL